MRAATRPRHALSLVATLGALAVLLHGSVRAQDQPPITMRVANNLTRRLDSVPLRQVDWDSFLAADPVVQSNGEPCIPAIASAQLGPCVSVALAQPVAVNSLGGPNDPVTGFTGYADTAHILYADLDGDGLEEAVIPTDSTGTGGSFGFLVYHQADPAPQLVVAYPGYKLGVGIENGLLVVSQPFYFGFEGNCCPTASTVHRYLLSDGGLYDAANTEYTLFDAEGNPRRATPAEITVAAFYRAIDQRAFDLAYGLVSPDVRAQRSMDAVLAGYARTRSVSATVAPGETAHDVRVTVTAVDEGQNGERVTRRYAGSWFVSFDDSAPLGVYLVSASIEEVTLQPRPQRVKRVPT